MKTVFADTYYFLALLNPRDEGHAKALAATASLNGLLLTTEYILVEIADALARPADRFRFLSLLATLQAAESTEVVPASSELLAKGIDLFRNRPDKDWPLTDCLTFVVMAERGVVEALTADEHFRQAGFIPALLDC
jgi:predicted nucleic acid-binding protein